MSDVPEKQIKRLKALITEAETNLAAAKELLVSLVGEDPIVTATARENVSGKVLEGVFDGQNMVGSDGKTYPVPANYASKSKLVQGDILKLTIGDDGAFLYKQIGQQLLATASTLRSPAITSMYSHHDKLRRCSTALWRDLLEPDGGPQFFFVCRTSETLRLEQRGRRFSVNCI
jgi:hypothetical protein